jgi:hypothetical protein
MKPRKLRQFKQYLISEPWWEQRIRATYWEEGQDPERAAIEAYENGWVEDYTGCILPSSYHRLPHKIAHIITAWLSSDVEDGKLDSGELYSPAATFHMWHKKLGGHGTGAY